MLQIQHVNGTEKNLEEWARIRRIGEFPRQEQKCMVLPTPHPAQKKHGSQPHHWHPLTSVVEESESLLLFSPPTNIFGLLTTGALFITIWFFFLMEI